MRRIQNRTIVGVTALILGGGYSADLLHTGWQSGRLGKSSAGYTAEQVVNLAERVCRQIEPGVHYDRFVLQYDPLTSMREPVRREWAAECMVSAAEGEPPPSYTVLCKWDADSGKLVAVSRDIASYDARMPKLVACEAVRRCRQWLRTFHMQQGNSSLTLAGPPEQNGIAWVVRFREGKHLIRVRINLYGDILQSIDYWY